MRPYITERTGFAKLLTVVLATSLFAISSCTDDLDKTNKNHNLSMNFATRAGEAPLLVQSARLFTFYDGTADDKKFHKEIRNLNRTGSQLTAQVDVGVWNMAMVANPNGGTIITPSAGTEMSKLPMYKYEPVTPTGGKSSDAHEIYLENKLTPAITQGVKSTMDAQLNRTVAKVELIIEKTTSNFNLNGSHLVKLHNVPSTISYTGALLPSKTDPDTLAQALQAPVTLQDAGTGYYQGAETITFIIPAHRGDAFTTNPPTDVTTLNMEVTVDLERVGGARFAKQSVIPVVAVCNKILRVHIGVSDGLEFKTEVLPWEGVDIDSSVGETYHNWLYVKANSTGSGLSWSDALPNINAAITKAKNLVSNSVTIHGILVAGGANAYSEAFEVPQGVRIFGGWEGTPGTELLTDNANEVYTSTARNLKDKKARVATGTGNIMVSGTGAVLDGFIVSGAGANSTSGLVTVTNADAWANAIEIDDQKSIASTYAFSVLGGKATNILVSRNNKGVFVDTNGKLVNATIAQNTAASNFGGTLFNSIYWGNGGTVATAGTIKYCAFQTADSDMTGMDPENYPLHETNNLAWFTIGNVIPGPHFKDLTIGSYEALNNNAPQLGRGSQTEFDNVVTLVDAQKDINGNPRHKEGTDIGCYEDDGNIGFHLRWYSNAIYVSARQGYKTDAPLLLPDNATQGIAVEWRIEDINLPGDVALELPYSGSGTGIRVGQLTFEPITNYTGFGRALGDITIKTNLKRYLPDEKVDIMQLPGTSAVWEDGYAGSFHRNNEMGARYISGPNIGDWSARIISGMEWIAIDDLGQFEGEDIASETNPAYTDGRKMKKVEEVFGGFVEGTGPIKFRVGMKSTLNPGDAPRYGLIAITRVYEKTGQPGIAMFFVRQGEQPDFLYRLEDEYLNVANSRTHAIKFSPFNLIAPVNSLKPMVDGGVLLDPEEAEFTKYPTMIGDYFQGNYTRAYRRDVQTSPLDDVTMHIDDIGNFNMFRRNNNGGILPAPDPSTALPNIKACPDKYRLGTFEEWVQSVYQNVPMPAMGPGDLQHVKPGDAETRSNFVWGRYADGLYDQVAGNGDYAAIGSTASKDRYHIGNNIYIKKGIILVNHNNYASLFFPHTGMMFDDPRWTAVFGSRTSEDYCFYNTSTKYTGSEVSTNQFRNNRHSVHNVHWTGGHDNEYHNGDASLSGFLAMSVFGTAGAASVQTGRNNPRFVHAVPVRCVYVGP